MKNNKIMIITRNMNSGGAERVIAQLANYFVQRNVMCVIVTVDDVDLSYKLDPSVRIISVGSRNKTKLLNKISQYRVVRKIAKDELPDVVLSMPEEIGVYVILALLGIKIPVYVSERNNPWVMPDVKVTRILRKLMYPFASGIIFQTKMAMSFFSKSIQKKGVVIGNPVDISIIPEPYVGIRRKIIVGAGRLERQKNFSLLISSFAEFSADNYDYDLYIYGEGKMKSQLEQEAKNLGVFEKTHFPGRNSNLLDSIKDCSMFVLSSDYEGMPNVLIEAMCVGMPVVSTDCPSGGPRELIDDHINGILVPVGDQKAMVSAMKECIDPSNQEMLSANAYNTKEKLAGTDTFYQWYSYLFKDVRKDTNED